MPMPLRDEKGRFIGGGAKAAASAGGSWEFYGGKMQKAIDRSKFENLRHAAARIAKDEKESITKSDEPSEPGEPPHTKGRGGKNLKGAIRFAADKDSGVIGPIASFVGNVGEAHEFGGRFRGQQFEKREFAAPALEKNIDRFGGDFRGSIGS